MTRAQVRARTERRRAARAGRICANESCKKPIPIDRLRAKYCSKVCQRTTPEMRVYQRGVNKKRLYGVSPEQFAEMLRRQEGRCAICRTDTPGGVGDFHVDHDHDGGQVRGLLCNACNLGLGRFKDDPSLLRTAAKYLEEA